MTIPQKIDSKSVEKYFNKVEVVEALAQQIVKDFGLFGISISFEGVLIGSYPDLLHQLAEEIQHLLNCNDNRLSSVLYQIDLKESELFVSKHDFPDYSNPELIAHQIIIRELKKVMYRLFYKG